MGIARAGLARTAKVIVCAVAVVALAGCDTGAKGQADSSSGRSPLQVVRASYDATLRARTARFSMTVSAPGITTNGTGAARFQPKELSMSVHGQQLGGGVMQVRIVDGRIYIKVPAAAAGKLPPGKSWLMLDLNKASSGPLGKTFGALTDQSPAKILGYLQSIKSVTRAGKQTIRGVQTTHYRAVIDLRKLATNNKQMGAAIRRMIRSSGKSTLVNDVYLDPQGRVVRQQLTVPTANPATGGQVQLKQRIDLYDFGRPVQITAPPRHDTVDLARLMSTGA